jgi:hypothetical protein
MMTPKPILILLACCLPVVGRAQQNDATVPVRIRAVLHDPVHPAAELFLTDTTGAVVRLELVREGFSKEQFALPVNGSLALYNSAAIDPRKPLANLAATTKLPSNIRQAMLIILPRPADPKSANTQPANAQPAYRIVLIDDSAKAFPQGEARVLPLVAVETAIQAGEHRLPIHPGVITNVPPVRKVNEFNMAQTNFYYKRSEAWVPFTERQLQYLDAYRRVFIIHVTPGAIQPSVTTIVDTTPAVLPRVVPPPSAPSPASPRASTMRMKR